MKKYFQACRFSIPSTMLSEIFMQINRILTKLCQLKPGGPVIMPHRDVYTITSISPPVALHGLYF